MDRYVCLLRGINVSGRNRLPMAELRQGLADLGYANIATYLQSGNAAFDAPEQAPRDLQDAVRAMIGSRFQLDIPTLITTPEHLQQVIAANPLKEDPAKLHATLLESAPDPGLIASINPAFGLPDRWQLIGSAIYLYCQEGYGQTKLHNAFFERKLKLSATTRNWNTLQALTAL